MSRELKRKQQREQIKATSRFQLINVIERQLDLIFDISYQCENPEKKDMKYIDFRPFFESLVVRKKTPFDEEIISVDLNSLCKKNKKVLLTIYARTAQAAMYICKYHDLNTEIINPLQKK